MKFQNLVVALCGLFFSGSSSFAAGLPPKTTVYPSTLFPGKIWKPAETSTTKHSIWHEQETQDTRYRPLDEENKETAPVTRRRAEYCIPPETEPMPKYRGEQEDMPRYRSEIDDDFRERPRPRRAPPEDLPSPPRYRYDSSRYDLDMPYSRSFPNMPPVWDWMDDPGFSTLYPPVNPDEWGYPYLRNSFSATEPGIEHPVPSLQVPLKNQHVPTVPALTISADWIPAPSSALVDSDEFKPNYVTRPNIMTLGEVKP